MHMRAKPICSFQILLSTGTAVIYGRCDRINEFQDIQAQCVCKCVCARVCVASKIGKKSQKKAKRGGLRGKRGKESNREREIVAYLPTADSW